MYTFYVSAFFEMLNIFRNSDWTTLEICIFFFLNAYSKRVSEYLKNALRWYTIIRIAVNLHTCVPCNFSNCRPLYPRALSTIIWRWILKGTWFLSIAFIAARNIENIFVYCGTSGASFFKWILNCNVPVLFFKTRRLTDTYWPPLSSCFPVLRKLIHRLFFLVFLYVY